MWQQIGDRWAWTDGCIKVTGAAMRRLDGSQDGILQYHIAPSLGLHCLSECTVGQRISEDGIFTELIIRNP